MRRILLTAILSLLLASCTNPDLVTSLGIAPDTDLSRGADTMTVQAQESFNILSIDSTYTGKLSISYSAQRDMVLLRPLTERENSILIQKVDFLYRTGKLDDKLSLPLDDSLKRACADTKGFVNDAIGDLDDQINRILDEIENAGVEVDRKTLDSFFSALMDMTDPDRGIGTVEDYLAIQLVEDLVMSLVKGLQIILLDIPSTTLEYTWQKLVSQEIWTTTGFREAVSSNAVELMEVLISAIGNLDSVACRIDSFVSLSDIIGALL